MSTSIEWRKIDDYYWAGPPGWTICRVRVKSQERFELWHTQDGQGRIVGARESLDAAQALFLEQHP